MSSPRSASQRLIASPIASPKCPPAGLGAERTLSHSAERRAVLPAAPQSVRKTGSGQTAGLSW